MATTQREKWKRSLAAWAIPAEILAQAEESPWIHPPALFGVPEKIEMTPSHLRAFEVMPEGGTLLDVGCGGGIAAFAVTPPAGHVIGVDHQPEMLEMFSANARSRNIVSEVYEGFWPAVASMVPRADVVATHHVVYNVSDIEPFIQELDAHARKRVVIEMPTAHPLASMSQAWKYFWKLDRPTGPTAQDLMSVLGELGIKAQIEIWIGQMRVDRDLDEATKFMRIRLCLPLRRESEVREFLAYSPMPLTRELATIWWDK
ncbi:MAG TPA: methyltransferase domain-containing protein [Candidatus Nanopelagicaceae bacterium]